MKKNNARLLTGPVEISILKMTLPMLIGMIGMSIFNIVDTYFVGQLGPLELAAMSYTFPVVMIQGAISMGLGVGASAIISRAIGQGDERKVKRLTTDSLILSVIIVTVIIIAGILTIDPLFSALGAKGKTLSLVKEYMFIWYLGVPFVTIPMIGNNAIRATGDTFTPSMIMVLAIIVNVILDPLLIYGIAPFSKMGLAGAALATVIARAVTLVASILLLHFRYGMLTFHFGKIQEIWNSWKKLLWIGVPAALTQLIIPISIAVITRMVSGYGDPAVAALGIGSKVEMFAFSPLMALGASLIPFIGQNKGAGQPERIQTGIVFAQKLALALGVVLFILLYYLGTPIAGFFINEKMQDTSKVIEVATLYFTIVSIGYGFQGLLALNAASFNALNRPLQASAVNALRMFALYIPLALIAKRFWGIAGIFWAATVSSVLAGAISYFWLKRELIRDIEELSPLSIEETLPL